MLLRKRLLVIFSLVLLLIFSLVSTATATQVTATAIINGKSVPVNVIPGGSGNQASYKLEIPWQDLQGNGKVTIRYTIDLQTLFPSAPAEKPAPRPQPPVPDSKPPLPRPEPTVPQPWPPVPDPKPPAPEPEPESPGTSPLLTAEELQMLNLVNQERAKMGLSELKIHEGLVKLARLKSKDMIDLGYFAHQSPTYGSPFDMMREAKIPFSYAGENLAGAPAVSRAHTSLMNSPGHRANILNADYTHIGIGIVDGGPYGKMFTQLFIGIK